MNSTLDSQASKVTPAAAPAIAAGLSQRQEFWIDTCREVREMRVRSPQVLTLYQQHGCRFLPPSSQHVEEVLAALDSAMAGWETHHPELFYQALELNFPELVRHH